MMVGGPYFIIEHARTIFVLVWIWFGLALLFAAFYFLFRLRQINLANKLISVWGDILSETPDARDAENAEEKPAALAVACPTCKAKRFQWCRTLAGNLEMRLVHSSRERKYLQFLQRHWSL
jgi:hypothetical protein